MIKATCNSKVQNHADETTIYWFDIEESDDSRVEKGEQYGIADTNGDLTVLDCDGCPVPQEYSAVLYPVLLITEEMIND